MFIRGSSGVSSHIKLHTYEPGYLLPVLSPEELLFGPRHKGLIRRFRDLAGVSREEFNATYGELLNHFLMFVQVLPHKAGGILGSLLNHSLARSTVALQKYCQLKGKEATPLLKFALFSAALLKDLGRVMSNQRIMLFTEDDEPIGEWNPFNGPMINQASCYKLYPISKGYLKIESEVTLLLARQLIPKEVFVWLSHDVVVFSDWVSALLSQEGDEAKKLTAFLAVIKREDLIAILSTLDGAIEQGEPPKESLDAEAFYEWITEMIRSGKIEVNAADSGVFMVEQGVLIEKKLFKQFADMCGRSVNFNVVFTKFGNLMGIPKKGGNDFLHAQYFSPAEAAGAGGAFSTFSANRSATSKGRAFHEGLVVDPHLVFIDTKTPELSSLQSVKAMVAAHHQSPSVIAAQNLRQQINHKSR